MDRYIVGEVAITKLKKGDQELSTQYNCIMRTTEVC